MQDLHRMQYLIKFVFHFMITTSFKNNEGQVKTRPDGAEKLKIYLG